MPPRSSFVRFWSPLNNSPKPALIYCGGGFVYKLSDEFLDAYRLKHGLKETRHEFFVDLGPGESVPSRELVPDKHFVPFGDLASTARIVTTLSSFKKPYDLRYGDDLAFTEFRTSPVILIGGLNNSWALKVTHNLRYVLDQDDRIVDQWHRDKVWTQMADPENQARDDYAIISRLSPSDNITGGLRPFDRRYKDVRHTRGSGAYQRSCEDRHDIEGFATRMGEEEPASGPSHQDHE